MPSLAQVAREELARDQHRSQFRSIVTTERLGGARVRRGGREFISFSCNDYLGLAHHPEVKKAARQALDRHGAGAGASRLVTGSHPLYAELEGLLAELKGAERALVFGSGYLANLGVIRALAGKDDLILADRLCHASMLDGARISGAAVERYIHQSVDDCQLFLARHRAEFNRCLILTETVFSMDGDRAPVAELAALAQAHDAWLLTDDAHGLGICSSLPADIQIGTLSKAVGGYGGYVCASADVIALFENRARSLMYSTGLPPATVAAAAAALRILRDDPVLRAKPLENARRFTAALGREPAQSAIVPVVVRESERALAASAVLEANGLLAVAIRPPTVPPGTSRLRFAFSAWHEPEPIERAAALLKDHGYA
ncbi:MAG: aminotransferase class I/II-fold pyridoxal phosphate-dependent enzyme [Isosphaeraceae bacterium]